MKKKILAVVTAAVLALGCASVAFALPSYNSEVMDKVFDENKFGIQAATTKVGDYTVNVSSIDTSKIDAGKKQGADDEQVKAILYTDLKKTSNCSSVIAIFEAKYDDLDEDNGTELVFYVDGVKADDKIAMWHWDNKALKWENTTCKVTKVEYNHVYVNVKKLSPVAFVKGGKGAIGADAEKKDAAKTAATNAKAAPKTGEV